MIHVKSTCSCSRKKCMNAYCTHGSFSSHSGICNVLMEHMECFLSSLAQTLPLIRAVEVSLSGHSPTADFTCSSRSFLQGKLQNLATLQKVPRHRKHEGQLWLSGSCLVLHMPSPASHTWKFYQRFFRTVFFNWKPLTDMAIHKYSQGSRQQKSKHSRQALLCLSDGFFFYSCGPRMMGYSLTWGQSQP